MITNFEQETKPLTKREQALVPYFLEGFKYHVGREKKVTSDNMISAFAKRGIKITGARVRKIINHIRINGLVKNLVAGSHGYWVEDNPVEIEKYKKSLLQRAEAIQAIANTFQ